MTRILGPALIVLAKAPESGLVKTRLCPPLTPEQAADLAAAALLDSLAAVTTVPGAAPVAVLTGDVERAIRRDAVRAALARVHVVAQRGEGLGARIIAAHADAAALLPWRRTLQIGMDTPQVDADLLIDADAAPHTRFADAVAALSSPVFDDSLASSLVPTYARRELRRPVE